MLLGWSVSDLPQGWSTFSIKDIGGLSGGKTPSKANASFWNKLDIPWVSPKDIKRLCITDSEDRISEESLSEASMTLYPQDSILMVTRSGILQHTFPVAITALPVTVNQDIKVIRPLPGISSRYMLYVLMAYGQRVLEKCSKAGTTVQSIDTEKLEAIGLPLAPTTEQVRIAKALDDLLAQVDTLKARLDALPALIKRFRQSVLAAAVSGELTEEISKKDGAASSQRTPLSVAVEDIRYGTAQKCAYEGGPTGVIRIPNISGSGIDLSDLKSSSFSHAELKKLSLNAGDIVLIRSNGSVDLVGKSAVVTEREQGLLFAGYLIRIRLKTDVAEPAYINYWLKSPEARISIENKARSTSGVNNINSQEILSLELMIPNLAEQRKIVRRADQLFAFADQLEARLAGARQRVDALTQSILAKAFCGELVPQDPNDEPASVLLERIAAQRAADPEPKRGRKAAAH